MQRSTQVLVSLVLLLSGAAGCTSDGPSKGDGTASSTPFALAPQFPAVVQHPTSGHLATTPDEPIRASQPPPEATVYAGAGRASADDTPIDAGDDASGDASSGPSLAVDVETDPDIGIAPMMVRFKADPYGKAPGPFTVEWDFGDGSQDEGNPVMHVFAVPGTFSVTVTVSNEQGQQVTQTVEIEVDQPPRKPGHGIGMDVNARR